MNSVRPNNLSLNYQRFTLLYRKDIGIRKFEFVLNISSFEHQFKHTDYSAAYDQTKV